MGDHDPDPSSPRAGADGGERCPCCSSPSSGAASWRRSVKRKLDADKGGLGSVRGTVGEEGEYGFGGSTARVDAEDECAALREAVAAAQASAARLQSEVEEERMAAASAASETMAMMLRLQRDKAEVQMELRQFRRFADEKMALDAAEIDHLRALLARRARRLLRLRATIREYRRQFVNLGVPLPEGEGQGDDDDDLLVLQGEAEDGDDGGYYPELRCYDGEYCYVEEQEGVAVDLERRICQLEHDHDSQLLQSPLDEDDEGHQLYADEMLPDSSSAAEPGTLYAANQLLPNAAVEEWNRLDNDEEETPESPEAGCSTGEEGVSESGVSSGSDRVYTIDKVHQGVSAPVARVPDKYLNEAVEPDIKKLYMRLEALEADRESMRQALVAMRTEKAQLVLLREIAQQLAKDGAPAVGVVPGVQQSPGKRTVGVSERRVMAEKKAALVVKKYSMVTLFKWILTLFCKKKKPRQSRYTFGMSSNNVGLLLLLDKCPRIQKTLTRTK